MAMTQNKRTLTSKIRIYMVFIGMLSIMVYFILSIFMYISSYDRMESSDLKRDAARTLEMIGFSAMDLQRIAKDYGVWDEAADRLKAGDMHWFNENYSAWMTAQQDIDMVAVIDRKGKLLDQSLVDEDAYKRLMESTVIRQVLAGAYDQAKTFPHGVLYIKGQYFTISVAPIMKMARKEPSLGMVVLGRSIDRVQLQAVKMDERYEVALMPQNEVLVKASTLDDPKLFQDFVNAMGQSLKPDVVAVYREKGFVMKDVIGLDGKPVGRLLMMAGSSAYRSLLVSINLAGLAVIFGIAVVVYILSGSLAYSITKPLEQLRRQIADMGSSTEIGTVMVNGTAEIEAIAEAFNDMSDNLRRVASENEKFKNPLNVDGLTGLFNQSYLYQYLDRHLQRHGEALHMMLLDADYFKKINRNFGHQAGDRVLQMIAEICRTSVGERGMVCRYAGEEFVCVMHDSDGVHCFALAEQIREKIYGSEQIRQTCGNIPVSVSIGLVAYPDHGRDITELLSHLNKAMEMAKHSGRNTTWLYNPEDTLEEPPGEMVVVHRDALVEALLQLVDVVDSKENYYTRHSEKVAAYADLMGRKLLENDRERYALNLAAMLHDCGKITIPEAIIEKPDALSFEEFEVVRMHPEMGYNLIQYSVDAPEILGGVRHHHERWDGKGYPDALMGSEIPLFARIIAIADAYQSIVSDRPYRAAKTMEEAIKEMLENGGTQFDPELVKLFVQLVRDENLQGGSETRT